MTVNKVGDPFFGRIGGNAPIKVGQGKKFGESLQEMKDAALSEEGRGTGGRGAAAAKMRQQTGSPLEPGGCFGAAAANLRTGSRGKEAVRECPVLNLTYAQSDVSKVYAQEGFTLKAKVYPDEGKVYLEQKSEDGTVKAYEIDPERIAGDTKDVLELAAAEAWEKAGAAKKSETKGETEWFHEEVLAFYERVKEQIRNGPPKIQTGGSALSVKEWDKLLEKIDDYLEEVRKEMEVRFEKERRRTEESADPDTAVWKIGEEKGNDEIDSSLLEKLLEDRVVVVGNEREISGSRKEQAETRENAEGLNADGIPERVQGGGSAQNPERAQNVGNTQNPERAQNGRDAQNPGTGGQG